MPSAISQPQPAVAQLTRAAIFLVVTVNSGTEHDAAVRTLRGDLAALLRAAGFRDLEGRLSCIMAFGSDAWDRLFGVPKPKELHPFREIRGRHHAVATPGDILFHIRSTRMDLCFELATLIVPSATFLENVAAGVAAPSIAGPSSNGRGTKAKSKSQLSPPNGSLGIGPLKKEA